MIEFLGYLTFLFLFFLCSYALVKSIILIIVSLKEYIEHLVKLEIENKELRQIIEELNKK